MLLTFSLHFEKCHHRISSLYLLRDIPASGTLHLLMGNSYFFQNFLVVTTLIGADAIDVDCDAIR